MLRAIYLALAVLALVLSALTTRTAPTLPAEFSARIAPIFSLGHRLGQNLRAGLEALTDRRDLQTENRALQERVAALEQENTRLRLEVARLSRALEVRQEQAPGVVAIAPVIAEDPSGLYQRMVIGLGEADGIRVGMPVTSSAGLVGIVIETSPHQAVVRTVVDPDSSVGVQVMGKPGRGIARGQPPARLRVSLPLDVEVTAGDLLVSNSLRGLFPAGIPVGRVLEVLPPSPGALRRWVVAEPVVRFSLLEEVVVLRPL
ncbi:rod shape-determining protein MreC [Marinithermus hydrothermalis]|uniref:Cell shape-determining protein MreC n=1 Tax=Marinithermus hydrothermalis (strain DSM 14884 / JCM 11576 / T1) TaxID=869210 RepID=F2NLW1_MARHT|nr:rod shape-determining protein MreC [Marinithermus hydrothermalis]AEB11218.1 Rod shape-determining protein MreC [Marinithermus hydrothermalis DSM 14884]